MPLELLVGGEGQCHLSYLGVFFSQQAFEALLSYYILPTQDLEDPIGYKHVSILYTKST